MSDDEDVRPGEVVRCGDAVVRFDPAAHVLVTGCSHGHESACPQRCQRYDLTLVDSRAGRYLAIVRSRDRAASGA